MGKGRRAADRRREREGDPAAVDPHADTNVSVSDDLSGSDDLGGDGVDGRAATALYAGGEGEQAEIGIGDNIADDTARLGDVAEVTAVRERPAATSRYGGKLHFLAGARAGDKVLINATPFVLGRADFADLVIVDDTFSRAHFELRYSVEERAWVVEDLGSLSGTLLNGAALEMATEIKHGDLLAAGQLEVRFFRSETPPEERLVEEEEPRERTRTGVRAPPIAEKTRTQATPTKPKASGGSKLPLIAGLIAAALIVLGGAGGAAYFAFVYGAEDAGQLQVQVESLAAEAQRLMDEEKFDQALMRLDAALALVPGHPLAMSLMRTAKSEREASGAIDEATRLFDEGKIEEALTALRRVPDSSRFAERRDELSARAGELARKANVRAIESLIEAGRLEDADKALSAHLKRWPRDAFAKGMITRVQALRDAPPPEDPTVARARAAFEKGDALKARIIVESAAAKGVRVAERYLADLDRFDASLARGKRLVGAKNRGARAELDKAWELLPRLGRSQRGASAKAMKKPLADALFLEGMAARAAGRPCDWASAILRAQGLMPRDRKVAAQARGVEQKAKAALVRAEARVGADPAKAAQIAREGLCYAARGSLTRKRLSKVAR